MANRIAPPPPEPRLTLADARHAERLFQIRREDLVRVDQPMVLISQIQRSGGTLLNSLLDGHPQLHVHPWEIQIGHPQKFDWPELDLGADADTWLEILEQRWLEAAFEVGYRKDRPYDPLAEHSLPVMVTPSFVESLFRILVAEDSPQTQREVLDRYFTAFFNGWLDYEGLHQAGKAWVAGFCPRLAWGESRTRWQSDYPEGRLVAIARDPRGWFASARAFKAIYEDLDEAIAIWLRGVDEIIAAKSELGDRVLVMAYETLVTEPEEDMRRLTEWLGIEWNASLLEPTFNRRPVLPDSSFGLPLGGIRAEAAEQWKSELTPKEQAEVERRALHAYYAALELVSD
jgi:hypothetical protein